MYDDFEDLDILDDDEDELQEDKPRSRAFTVIAGVLGVLIVFAIITVAAYLLFSKPDDGNNIADVNPIVAQTETAQAQQKFIGESLTQTAVALADQEQATEPPPTATATQDISPTSDTAATIQAAYTQAVALQTEQAGSATDSDELPDTGLIDDLGIPGIIAFSTLLFLVIIVVRRVRTSNS
jgi:hypothetical protein